MTVHQLCPCVNYPHRAGKAPGREVESDRLREQLWEAIQGRGAFCRFKDLLARHPDLEQRWYAFKARRVEQRMLEWLAYHDIEPVSE
jgi:hypothetical protein